MQGYTIFFITVNALHVPSLLAVTASGSSKQAWQTPNAVQFLSSRWWAEEPPETCRTL